MKNKSSIKSQYYLLLLISVLYIFLAYISSLTLTHEEINPESTIIIISWVALVSSGIFLIVKLSSPSRPWRFYVNYDPEKLLVGLGLTLAMVSASYTYRSFEIVYSALSGGDSTDLRNLLLFGEASITDPVISRIGPIIRTISLYLMLFFSFKQKKIFFLFLISFALIEASYLSRAGIILISLSVLFYLQGKALMKKAPMMIFIIYFAGVAIGYMQNRITVNPSILEIIAAPLNSFLRYSGYTFALASHPEVVKDLSAFPSYSSIFGWPFIKVYDLYNSSQFDLQISNVFLYSYMLATEGYNAPANYVHSTPYIAFVVDGMFGYTLSAVLTIATFFFLYRKFDKEVSLVFLFFSLYRASFTPVFFSYDFYLSFAIVICLGLLKKRSSLSKANSSTPLKIV